MEFTENLSMPVKPMIGVIGLATAQDKIHATSPGSHE